MVKFIVGIVIMAALAACNEEPVRDSYKIVAMDHSAQQHTIESGLTQEGCYMLNEDYKAQGYLSMCVTSAYRVQNG